MSGMNVDREVVEGFAAVIDRVYKQIEETRKALDKAAEEVGGKDWNDDKAKEVKVQLGAVRAPLGNAMKALLELDTQISIWHEQLKEYEEA